MNYGITFTDDSPCLKHHGVQGQQWGKRNGPPYPLDKEGSERLKAQKKEQKQVEKASKKPSNVRGKFSELQGRTIPKGTKLYRVQAKGENLPNNMVFAVTNKADIQRIKGITPWLMNARGKKNSDARLVTLKATEDISIAPMEEVAKIQNDLYKTNKEYRKAVQDSVSKYAGIGAEYTKEVQDAVAEVYKAYDSGNAQEVLEARRKRLDTFTKVKAKTAKIYLSSYEKLTRDKVGKDTIDKGIQAVNGSLSMIMNGNEKAKEIVRTELSKKGFNAIYDNAMIGANASNAPEAYEPIVVFNSSSLSKKKERGYPDIQYDSNARLRLNAWYTLSDRASTLKKSQH